MYLRIFNNIVFQLYFVSIYLFVFLKHEMCPECFHSTPPHFHSPNNGSAFCFVCWFFVILRNMQMC